MQVLPEGLLEQLHSSCLRGSLAALAMHPSANFGVQAFLAALHTSQQVPILAMNEGNPGCANVTILRRSQLWMMQILAFAALHAQTSPGCCQNWHDTVLVLARQARLLMFQSQALLTK